MNRLLTFARGGRLADPDGHLLGRFLADRDEAAFAELVRRYAPVVWGACRRTLATPADAEDAFQAAFLVLVRRAGRLTDHPALGPWLYRVAVLTARNLARANRRRQPLAGRLDHDIPAADPPNTDARLDLDAALSSLSDRQRSAVVLCHLQGLTRKDAADRLGCAEGTLSATLAAALKKLRARLAGRDPLVILAAGVVTPAGLSAATARTAAIYATSALRTAGVSPAVAGLTEGVLRMFWVKKVTVAAGLAVAAAGLAVGLGSGSGVARQDGEKAAPPAKADAGKEAGGWTIPQLTAELRALEEQELTVQKRLDQLRLHRRQVEAQRTKAQEEQTRKAMMIDRVRYARVELHGDDWSPGIGHLRVEEFDADGQPAGGYGVSGGPRLLRRLLAAGLADPDGPRKAVVQPMVPQVTADRLNAVLQALKDAGLKEVIYVPLGTAYPTAFDEGKLIAGLGGKADGAGPVTLDLTKFGDKTKAVATPGEGGVYSVPLVKPTVEYTIPLPKKP